MKTVATLLAALAVQLITGSAAAKLNVGDKAPPLKIAAWVQGKPADVSKPDRNTLYIVEFWATWCGPCRISIPHMTELQKHFGSKRLVVVGISDEDEDVVRPFVEANRARMQYTVAVDDDGKTNKAYMRAAGIDGIPHAFIVRDGRIAWHGHPMEMDDQIVKLTGDKEWSRMAAKRHEIEEKREGLERRMREAGQQKRWDDVLSALDQMSALDPGGEMDTSATINKYVVLAAHKKDAAAAGAQGARVLKNVKDTAALNGLAWGILTDDTFNGARDLKLALALAEQADKLSGGRDPMIIDTLARAKFDTGAKDEAIKLQERAVSLCRDSRLKAQLQESLDRYRNGKGD